MSTHLSTDQLLHAYTVMRTIRDFEERLHVEFATGEIPGFVHLYAGQEASAAGVMAHLNDDDCIASNHRGHGHCIAKGVDVDRLQREAHMMGELVGLGLRGVGKAAVNIDLVPATVEEERASERRRPYLIATAAALILGAAVFGFYKNSAAKKADGLVKEIEGQVENLVQFEAPLKKLNNEERNLRNLADGYVGADRSHAYWVDLLGELKEGMASDGLVSQPTAGRPRLVRISLSRPVSRA